MDFTKLNEYIDMLPELGIPSTDVMVMRGHETVYRHMSGYADAASTRPVSEQSLYWIWSCSKVSLCTAGLQLLEKGMIALDDPISRYIPEFERLFVKDGSIVRPARTELLVRHAFTMQSGWDYGATGRLAVGMGDVHNNIDLARALASVPLNFDPGTRYEYGLSHDLLGAMIEKLTGVRLGEYLAKNIFEPLGMKNTGFHPTPEQVSRITDRYNYNNETNASTLLERMDSGMGGEVEMGSGGLFSCTDDYILLVDALANGGVGATGARILRPETIELCRHNLLEGQSLEDFRAWQPAAFYGYGWGLCGRVHMSDKASLSRTPIGEFGWNGAAASYCMVDPDNRTSIFIAMHVHNCNYAYNMVHHRIRNFAYEIMGL